MSDTETEPGAAPTADKRESEASVLDLPALLLMLALLVAALALMSTMVRTG